MSYDLCGTKPTAREGTHYRMSISAWPLLAKQIMKFAPEECSPCAEWYGADCLGRGLEAQQALRLAAKLRELIAGDSILDHITELQQGMSDQPTLWMSQGDLRDFVSFLETCGGFQIT